MGNPKKGTDAYDEKLRQTRVKKQGVRLAKSLKKPLLKKVFSTRLAEEKKKRNEEVTELQKKFSNRLKDVTDSGRATSGENADLDKQVKTLSRKLKTTEKKLLEAQEDNKALNAQSCNVNDDNKELRRWRLFWGWTQAMLQKPCKLPVFPVFVDAKSIEKHVNCQSFQSFMV